MSAIIPDDNYSPYDFIFILTFFFGIIFIVGPILVPRGPDRETIRIGIMLTSFYMWIAWVIVYSSQVHPISGLRFKRSTLLWLSFSWGNTKGIEPITLPTTTTTTTLKHTTPVPTSTTSTQPTTLPIPIELLATPPRSTIARTTPTTTKTMQTTTARTTSRAATTIALTTTVSKTSTTQSLPTGQLNVYNPHYHTYVMFEMAHTTNKGFLEYNFSIWDYYLDPTLLLSDTPDGKYPAMEYVMLTGERERGIKINTKDQTNRRFTRILKEGVGRYAHFRVEWDGAKIDVNAVRKPPKSDTHLLTWINPDPFVIRYGGFNRGHWSILGGAVRFLDERYVDPDASIHTEEALRANNPDSTSKRSLRTATGYSSRGYSSRDFLLASTHYSFYKVTMEPISISVLSELDDYREFFVLLSTTDSRSEPRILIHIGGENGRNCTISKNGIIKVRVKCNVDWRKNTYLPFYIWHKNGKVVVKSGYGVAEHTKRLIYWNDPKPFAINFFGLRTLNEEMPMLVKNVEDEDWEL